MAVELSQKARAFLQELRFAILQLLSRWYTSTHHHVVFARK